jgi:hypothetical protein
VIGLAAANQRPNSVTDLQNQSSEIAVPTIKTKLNFQHHHLNNLAISRSKSM